MSEPLRPRYGAIALHPISIIDPVLANVVQRSISNHIMPHTQAGYNSATKNYLHFCSIRGVDPWPPDPVWVAAWVVRSTTCVSVRTMLVYLSALRSATEDQGIVWSLSGNVLVAVGHGGHSLEGPYFSTHTSSHVCSSAGLAVPQSYVSQRRAMGVCFCNCYCGLPSRW